MRALEPPTFAICAFTERIASSMSERSCVVPGKSAVWIITIGVAQDLALHDGIGVAGSACSPTVCCFSYGSCAETPVGNSALATIAVPAMLQLNWWHGGS